MCSSRNKGRSQLVPGITLRPGTDRSFADLLLVQCAKCLLLNNTEALHNHPENAYVRTPRNQRADSRVNLLK